MICTYCACINGSLDILDKKSVIFMLPGELAGFGYFDVKIKNIREKNYIW